MNKTNQDEVVNFKKILLTFEILLKVPSNMIWSLDNPLWRQLKLYLKLTESVQRIVPALVLMHRSQQCGAKRRLKWQVELRNMGTHEWLEPTRLCQSEEEHMWCIPLETPPGNMNEKLLPLRQMGSRLLALSLGTALFHGVRLNHYGSHSSHTSKGEISRKDNLVLQPLALILLSSWLK